MPQGYAVGGMQWRGAEVDPDVSYPEPESWTPVEVPGRPDEFAGADAVAYQATFDDPRSGAESHAVLDLRGTYARATVWCNGTEIATHDVYFAPLRVSLDDHLTDDNDLRIVCRRPADAFGGVYETDQVPASDAVPGIWWDARIRTYPGSYIDRLTARPRLDDGEATVRVSATVVADEDIDDRMTLSVRPEGSRRGRGMMERASVTAGAGERTTVDHTIAVRDPALWWPAELGDQNRYVIRAKLDGIEKTVSTGFCSVDYGADALTVNGTETAARGVNLLDATAADVERAGDLNANLVRAHAHVPSREVVDACVESGLLLWQDLPLTGPASVDIDRGQEVATALTRHYGNAPALAAVAVHDDPVGGFDAAVGSGLLDRLAFRWRRWRAAFDDSTASAIAESLPPSVPSFPVVGPPWVGPDAATFYPGWYHGSLDGMDALREQYPEPAVVAEFGAGALVDDNPGETAGFEADVHRERLGETGPESSQAHQATVCKRVAERLRQEGAPVLVAFALRDTGEAGMGVLARDGTPKSAASALATAYEPIQATLADPTGEESEVVVHNDLATRFTGTLTWESPAGDGETDVTVGTNAYASVTSVPLPDPEESIELRLSVSDRTVTNTYEV